MAGKALHGSHQERERPQVNYKNDIGLQAKEAWSFKFHHQMLPNFKNGGVVEEPSM